MADKTKRSGAIEAAGAKESSPGVSESQWRKQRYDPSPKRQSSFAGLSFREPPPLVSPETLPTFNYADHLGFPGEYPFTRGIHPTMYRGKIWTMRQFAGFGTPEDTNARFRFLLQHGQTGLSTAFDMPTLMGYDADSDRSRGEVGREGVSVSTIEDFERLFADIPLEQVTVSMTINCTATIMFAFLVAVAKRRNLDLAKIGGTIQNDMLKEFIAQKEWICGPVPAVRLSVDLMQYSFATLPRFNPVSVSGYHIREAGATATQELGFTLMDGLTYVEELLRRGLNIDEIAPRISFFFDLHNDFFEEICKLRAARRMWARFMKERFGAKSARSQMLRTHAQTAGVSLTAQQPLNNVVRVTLQALAGVLGGVQSLHTNSMDETLSLPTPETVKLALRTQQIIAEESGVANVIDPLGGSYYIEWLTNELEREALEYITEIERRGGMQQAVEQGYPQSVIADAAYKFQLRVERGEESIVGINKFCDGETEVPIPIHKVDPMVEQQQIARVREFRAGRQPEVVANATKQVRDACQSGQNIMPALVAGVDAGLTLGEISAVYREVFGEYRESAEI